MGWSRRDIQRTLDVSNRNQKGYEHKLCPYSTAYREKYKFAGEICIGFAADNTPIKSVGTWVMGNSTDIDFHRADYDIYECSDHTTTSGRMQYISNPPGWVCEDPNCYYFTIESGRCYREV